MHGSPDTSGFHWEVSKLGQWKTSQVCSLYGHTLLYHQSGLISHTSPHQPWSRNTLGSFKTKIHFQKCLKTCMLLKATWKQQGQRWCEHTDRARAILPGLPGPHCTTARMLEQTWTDAHRRTFPLCTWEGTSENFFLHLWFSWTYRAEKEGIKTQGKRRLSSSPCVWPMSSFILAQSITWCLNYSRNETGCEWILFCVSYRIKSSLLLEGVLFGSPTLGCFTSIALAKIKGFQFIFPHLSPSHAESSSGWAFWGTNWCVSRRSLADLTTGGGSWGVETQTQAGCPQATGSVGSIRRMWQWVPWLCVSLCKSLFPVHLNF